MSLPAEISIRLQPQPVRDAGHPDYLERVYAGVLGKLIGVYLGRPVENWSYERIRETFGEVDYYVHDRLGRRLIVTDDDITGTFTFLRALEDYDYDSDLSAAQIGQTWLNYLIEKTTILWWGGMGNSTEHTAYLRLKRGIPAPRSGSQELNGKVISEQIGAQIFIDGWGLICPGDPERAADFARRAASVSHDGEAIYGAQVVAALVASAFVESDLDRLLDEAVRQIPIDSIVRRLIDDVRGWHAQERDWRVTREQLQSRYGYDRYPGQCHLVPNHGLIVLSLLYGGGDFDESMKIVNTSGWDTDCNSGNVGAILGVRNGLAGFEGKDWRGPVADRLFLPSADGGRSVTDAVREAVIVANAGRRLVGLPALAPKEGRRFHFDLPGAVQGWTSRDGQLRHLDRSLLLAGAGAYTTPTFITPEIKDLVTGYVLVANPTLFSGQVVSALVTAQTDAELRWTVGHYGPEDESLRLTSEALQLAAGESRVLEWTVPDTGGYPIHEVGFVVEGGDVALHWLDWSGVPQTSWHPVEGTMWGRAWTKAIDRFEYKRDRFEYLTHSEGFGVLAQGDRKWRDYRIEARLTPRMAVAQGLAFRYQGLRRFYAFVFGDAGEIRIDKCLDGRGVLAKGNFNWKPFTDYEVAVEVRGDQIKVFIDGKLVLATVDSKRPLVEGAFGMFVEEGCMGAGDPRISPL